LEKDGHKIGGNLLDPPILEMQRRLVVSISIAYFVAFFGVGVVIASLGPIMLALSIQTGAEVDNLAFLFTSRAVGYLLGSVVGGALVDRIPGHRLLFSGLIANSVATGLFPFLRSIPLLAVLSSVQGLTMGFLDTGIAVAAIAHPAADTYNWQQPTSFCCGCTEIRALLGCKRCIVVLASAHWCLHFLCELRRV
jgi:sugar phosphate permease